MSDTELQQAFRVRRARDRHNQDDAAELCGVSRTAYQAWEASGVLPRTEQLPAVADYLELTGNQLLDMLRKALGARELRESA